MLTRTQGLRIVITWSLFFSTVLTIATLPVVLVMKVVSLFSLALVLGLVFLIGMVLFGLTACYAVFATNHTLRLRQEYYNKKAATTSSPSGGQYGS